MNILSVLYISIMIFLILLCWCVIICTIILYLDYRELKKQCKNKGI
jgi:heme/copper-type cytochrome/quinol oxidase subunit 2